MRRNALAVIGAVSHKLPWRQPISYATFAMRGAPSHQIVRESTYLRSASRSQDPVAEDDATMPDTVEKVAERLARLENTVAQGFYDVNRRFDNVDARFDKVDARLDKVDARLDKVDARLDKVDARFDKVDAQMKILVEMVQGLSDQIRGRRD
jgi:chromosome segregation ATPase